MRLNNCLTSPQVLGRPCINRLCDALLEYKTLNKLSNHNPDGDDVKLVLLALPLQRCWLLRLCEQTIQSLLLLGETLLV